MTSARDGGVGGSALGSERGRRLLVAALTPLAMTGAVMTTTSSAEAAGRGARAPAPNGVASAVAAVRRVAPVGATPRSLTFPLTALAPAALESARLVGRHHRARISLRHLQAAAREGRVQVRRPRWARRIRVKRLRLVLRVRTARSVPRVAVANPVAIASGALGNPGCLPAYGTFGAVARPPGCWRPYSPQSAFNREISAGAPSEAGSSAIVGRVLSFGRLENVLAGTAGRGELDGGRPVYYSSPADPVFRVHCTESWGTCAIEGAQIRIADRARPAGGSDAHLSVVDQASGWEYDFWGVESKPAGGGALTIRWGGKTPIAGNGLGSDAVAAQYGTAAGVLRAEELASGRINHALLMNVRCDSGSWVYPATKGGSPCPDRTNAPAEGMRFQLTMTDAQIAALPVPDWKKAVLEAMAHYGMIVGDTGGSWGIAQESGVVYTSFGQPDRWVTLAQQYRVPYYAPDQDYVFDLNDGVDWARYLRVVKPCVSEGTC